MDTTKEVCVYFKRDFVCWFHLADDLFESMLFQVLTFHTRIEPASRKDHNKKSHMVLRLVNLKLYKQIVCEFWSIYIFLLVSASYLDFKQLHV